jgi:hypothetical protein
VFFVFYVFYLRKDFIGAISDQLYPSNFIIPIDTHYISTEKRTAIASDVWFFAICSTKRAVSCLPHCKMNCILAGGFAVSVQQYQFRRKLSGAMTSVTNIHHFSDGDVRQGVADIFWTIRLRQSRSAISSRLRNTRKTQAKSNKLFIVRCTSKSLSTEPKERTSAYTQRPHACGSNDDASKLYSRLWARL